jgi:hypothetical protein
MGKGVTKGHRTSRSRTADEVPDDQAPLVPRAITTRQQQALQVLLTGATDTAAAEAAGVSRETVCRWRHRDANFVAALNEARQDLSQDFHDGLRALLPDALAALRDGLAADNINTRVRVASTLFRTLRDIGEPTGPTNPEAIRVAWQSAESELDLDRLFSIF